MKDDFKFRQVPPAELAHKNYNPSPVAVFQSRTFLLQVFREEGGIMRLSVNRTEFNAKRNRWEDGISWEALQAIKAAIGYGDKDAVEVYPRESDVVNVANMRHLFIMPDLLSYAWRKSAV